MYVSVYSDRSEALARRFLGNASLRSVGLERDRDRERQRARETETERETEKEAERDVSSPSFRAERSSLYLFIIYLFLPISKNKHPGAPLSSQPWGSFVCLFFSSLMIKNQILRHLGGPPWGPQRLRRGPLD